MTQKQFTDGRPTSARPDFRHCCPGNNRDVMPFAQTGMEFHDKFFGKSEFFIRVFSAFHFMRPFEESFPFQNVGAELRR